MFDKHHQEMRRESNAIEKANYKLSEETPYILAIFSGLAVVSIFAILFIKNTTEQVSSTVAVLSIIGAVVVVIVSTLLAVVINRKQNFEILKDDYYYYRRW